MKVHIKDPGTGAEIHYSNLEASRFYDWYWCDVLGDDGTVLFSTTIDVEPRGGPKPNETQVLERFKKFARKVTEAALPLWQ